MFPSHQVRQLRAGGRDDFNPYPNRGALVQVISAYSQPLCNPLRRNVSRMTVKQDDCGQRVADS